jgi:ankyrin repeat protein
LHRHPAFFGSVDDVIQDCCGHCPAPITIEEEEVAEKESKTYVAGPVTFMKDDCGRQAIGSFNPLSPDDYTNMAYVGNTELLCQAIIDKDLHYVEQWLKQDGNDPNTRDHTGRCPLHLAVSYSSLEVVQCLIDQGARLVARLVDGKTALHLACLRGDASMVSALLRKSEANEDDDLKKTDERRKLRMEAKAKGNAATPSHDSTFEMIDKPASEMDIDAMTDGSMVYINDPAIDAEGNVDGDDSDSPDVYDVNVLTWDTPTSPLHLAILSGHQAVVQCLVQDFGANILLPVVLPAHYAGGHSRGALLTLTLAFTLPLKEAEDMTRLLFKLGASSAQADSSQKTALEYCISNRPLLLETYLTSDTVGVSRAIRHVSVQGTSYNSNASGPLLAAIANSDLDTALRLLAAGARPDVPFEAYLKGIEKTAHISEFESKIEQPVVRAVEAEMPLVSSTLVESHGVNSNTLTTRGVHATFGLRSDGQLLLDLVNEKIKGLREWKHEARECDPPAPLENDGFYLDGLMEGTYQHWCATKQIESAKRRYEREWENHVRDLSSAAYEEVGLEEKQAAVYDKLDQFRKLQTVLHAKSAKTFKELHPEVEEQEDNNQIRHLGIFGGGGRGPHGFHQQKREPFELIFGFNVAIPSEEVRSRYVCLFEAAWTGDVKTIKELTLLAWTNSDGEKQPPLQIAVKDQQNHSPLTIAVLSGKLDLAKMILDIAAAQYTPPDPPKAHRYHVATNSDHDEDSNNGDDDGDDNADLPISSEVIDDNLTIEDIGEISLSVKSNIKPATMLYWEMPDTGDSTMKYTPETLMEYALARGDLNLLSFILDVSQESAGRVEITGDQDSLYQHFDFSRALLYGQPHMLAELIKRTAIGLSIDELALEHGATDSTAAPKYYQGLSVHGKKRKDWAAAGRNTSGMEETGPQVPPLLRTAHGGTLEQTEWMLSDTPLRCYKHFAQAHQDDQRLQKISPSAGGFEGALKGFLQSRSHLAIHCCLARSDQTADTLEMLKHLVEVLPEAVEARSDDHLTPLLRAFQLHNLEAARILIEAGADQTARDRDGMNLMHQLMSPKGHVGHAHEDVDHMRAMIETIDKRLIVSMCFQRSSAETPLSLWMSQLRGSKEFQANVTRLLLEYGDGSELEALNGAGLTVLHTVAQRFSNGYEDPRQYLLHAKVILEHHPGLVFWENATGKTSLELVEDQILALKCSGDKDNVGRRHQYYGHLYGRPQSITDRQPREFIKQEASGDVDMALDANTDQLDLSPKQHAEMMRKLLVATQAKLEADGGGKRRLVTLHEASEVARRLAATQRKRTGAQDEALARREVGHRVSDDQVEQWFRSAPRCCGPVL